MELIHTSGFEIILSLQHETAGRETGIKPRFLEFILLLAEFRGFPRYLNRNDIRFYSPNLTAHVHQQSLIQLLQTGLLLEQANFCSPQARFICM